MSVAKIAGVLLLCTTFHIVRGTDAPGPLHQWNSSSEPLTVGTDAPGRLPHWNSSNESLTLGNKR
ncbi:UNVERIFIED_CONTAM: hypothetical protein NCL1_22087 [Trichonephila clavipes]